MDPASTFDRYGTGHLLALALTILVPLALAAWTRARGESIARPLGIAFAVLLVGAKYSYRLYEVWTGQARMADSLPMHLCDWALLAATVALLTRHVLAFELAWFWGVAGTLQALLTPDLRIGFESLRTWIFFLSHGGIIAAGIYLAVGGGMRPRPWVVLRVWGWSQVYLLAALLVNAAAGTNYGYTCAKPAVATLLDALGPWPWYLLALEALALAFYTVAAVPFWVERAFGRRG